jgi:hypothetical protein
MSGWSLFGVPQMICLVMLSSCDKKKVTTGEPGSNELMSLNLSLSDFDGVYTCKEAGGRTSDCQMIGGFQGQVSAAKGSARILRDPQFYHALPCSLQRGLLHCEGENNSAFACNGYNISKNTDGSFTWTFYQSENRVFSTCHKN